MKIKLSPFIGAQKMIRYMKGEFMRSPEYDVFLNYLRDPTAGYVNLQEVLVKLADEKGQIILMYCSSYDSIEVVGSEEIENVRDNAIESYNEMLKEPNSIQTNLSYKEKIEYLKARVDDINYIFDMYSFEGDYFEEIDAGFNFLVQITNINDIEEYAMIIVDSFMNSIEDSLVKIDDIIPLMIAKVIFDDVFVSDIHERCDVINFNFICNLDDIKRVMNDIPIDYTNELVIIRNDDDLTQEELYFLLRILHYVCKRIDILKKEGEI